MAAGIWDFTIEQGATFERRLVYAVDGVPVSLVGWTARMQFRSKIDSADVLFTLTTENDRITLTEDGEVILFASAVDTATLAFKTAAHDLELVNPAIDPIFVKRLVQGTVTLSKEVTR